MKTIIFVFTLIFVLNLGFVWALTVDSPLSSTTENSSDGTKKIQTTTVVVKKIDGNTIHTNTGTYDISGAKVVDFTKDKNFKSDGRKTATLTFIDGRLVDVVIK